MLGGGRGAQVGGLRGFLDTSWSPFHHSVSFREYRACGFLAASVLLAQVLENSTGNLTAVEDPRALCDIWRAARMRDGY